eukprot:gene5576-9392_t
MVTFTCDTDISSTWLTKKISEKHIETVLRTCLTTIFQENSDDSNIFCSAIRRAYLSKLKTRDEVLLIHICATLLTIDRYQEVFNFYSQKVLGYKHCQSSYTSSIAGTSKMTYTSTLHDGIPLIMEMRYRGFDEDEVLNCFQKENMCDRFVVRKVVGDPREVEMIHWHLSHHFRSINCICVVHDIYHKRRKIFYRLRDSTEGVIFLEPETQKMKSKASKIVTFNEKEQPRFLLVEICSQLLEYFSAPW